MDQKSIENFLLQNAGNFNECDVARIAEGLSLVPDEFAIQILGSEFKKSTFALLFSCVGGTLGLDRFYMGQTMLGVAKLLTCGGFGIWTIVDIFSIMGVARQVNSEKIVELINKYSIKTQRPSSTEMKPVVKSEVENSIAPQEEDLIIEKAHTPGSENPMDYAPKESDHAKYAPKSFE